MFAHLAVAAVYDRRSALALRTKAIFGRRVVERRYNL